MKKVVDAQNAKSAGYRRVIEKIAQKGHCPFCPENFKYHKHPILKRSGDWFITRISWPYRKTQLHFLIIGKAHKERLEDLNGDDMASMLNLMKWVTKKHGIRGGGLAMRFGETALTGATVCHLHCHLIVPKLNSKTGRAWPVSFPIG